MTFPVLIHLGAWRIPPHSFFEAAGWTVAGALVLYERSKRGDVLARQDRWTITAAAVVGAIVGARSLFWLQHAGAISARGGGIAQWPVGKTVVGGLIGATIAVEITKRVRGVRVRTGDLFALPLAIGLAIGRIGCFLTGLSDDTFGTPTRLITGVDFGDGIPRHPTQLYESAFLVLLAAAIAYARPRMTAPGAQFRLFMISYLAFRIGIDFIKPEPALALGLSAIQWACVAMLAYYATGWSRANRLSLAASGPYVSSPAPKRTPK